MKSQKELILEYFEKRLERIENKIKEDKHTFLNSGKEILEMKNRISDLEHRVDFAYEAFSPISVQQQVIKAETDRLKEELEEKLEAKAALQKEIDELEREAAEIKGFLASETEDESKNELKAELKAELKGVSKAEGCILIEQQELERQRIARELHDTTVQNLTALIHKIDFCTQILNSDPIRVRLELEIMSQVIRDSVNGMRDIIYNLRPMTFDDMGFENALSQAVERMQRGFDTKIVLETEGESYPVNQVVQLTILRIIQEAVNNCKKYAKAKMIDITLSYRKEGIVLSIMDDGVGFDTAMVPIKKEKNTGFGLSMMRERICLLNGTFEIESKLGFGTEIQVNIPINEEK